MPAVRDGAHRLRDHHRHQRHPRAQGRAGLGDHDARLPRHARDRAHEPDHPLRHPRAEAGAAGAARARVIEVDERVAFDGTVAAPAPRGGGPRGRRPHPAAANGAGHRGAVVLCFLHSYVNPAHERAAARVRWPRRCRAGSSAPRRRCCPSSASTSGSARRRSTPTSARRWAAISTRSGSALGGHGYARPGVHHDLERRDHDRRRSPRGFRSTRCSRARPAGWPPRSTSARLTGHREPHHLRHGRHQHRRLPRSRTSSRRSRPSSTSPGCRTARRRSRSTRSGPAAAASRGSTPATSSGSGRGAPAPCRGRPATGAAATEPTITDANLVLRPDGRRRRPWRASWRSTARWPARRCARLLGARARARRRGGAGRRDHPHRGGAHGRRDQGDLDRQGPRSARLRAGRLRRRGARCTRPSSPRSWRCRG